MSTFTVTKDSGESMSWDLTPCAERAVLTALRHVMGDVGEPNRRIHIEPLPESVPAPETTPATTPAKQPTEPVPV